MSNNIPKVVAVKTECNYSEIMDERSHFYCYKGQMKYKNFGLSDKSKGMNVKDTCPKCKGEGFYYKAELEE